jgi:ankyrin repeat protein
MPQKKQSVVLSIRLDDISLKAVDLLVESGLESNRSRAVSYLLQAGIQSSQELLQKARILADNVQLLRNQMIDAVKQNNIEQVSRLISQDASLVNASNQRGESAMLMAAYYRSQEIKELLLSSGAELNLFEAAAIGDTDRIRQVLGASPELAATWNADGFTALGLAAHFGNEDAVKLLLEYGADINQRGQDGNLDNMAIHAAIAGNHAHVVKLLLERGADITAKCEGEWRRGFTPLHVAAYFGRDTMIGLLLEAGADKTSVTEQGKTPYDLAIFREHPKSAALLQ